MVANVNPADGVTGVPVNSVVTWTFNEAIDPTTATTANFTLAAGAAVSGTVTIDGTNKVVTFTPDAALTAATVYTATAKATVAAPQGHTLTTDHVTTFTTA